MVTAMKLGRAFSLLAVVSVAAVVTAVAAPRAAAARVPQEPGARQLSLRDGVDEDAYVTLREGSVVSDSVGRYEANYYVVRNLYPFNLPVTVTVSPEEGDADLAVACNPALDDAQMATRGGTNTDSVRFEYANCDSSGGTLDVFIKVYGHTASSYGLSAVIYGERYNEEVIELTPASPGDLELQTTGHVNTGQDITFAYFGVMHDSLPATVTVVPTTHPHEDGSGGGDPDVRVSCNPTGDDFLESALGPGMTDTVVVETGDAACSVHGTSPAAMFITVSGTAASDFDLRVTLSQYSNATRTMVLGEEVDGASTAAFQEFHYVLRNITGEDFPVSVQLASLTADHDLYASCVAGEASYNSPMAAKSVQSGTQPDGVVMLLGHRGCTIGTDAIYVTVRSYAAGTYSLLAQPTSWSNVDWSAPRMGMNHRFSRSIDADEDVMYLLDINQGDFPVDVILETHSGEASLAVGCLPDYDDALYYSQSRIHLKEYASGWAACGGYAASATFVIVHGIAPTSEYTVNVRRVRPDYGWVAAVASIVVAIVVLVLCCRCCRRCRKRRAEARRAGASSPMPMMESPAAAQPPPAAAHYPVAIGGGAHVEKGGTAAVPPVGTVVPGVAIGMPVEAGSRVRAASGTYTASVGVHAGAPQPVVAAYQGYSVAGGVGAGGLPPAAGAASYCINCRAALARDFVHNFCGVCGAAQPPAIVVAASAPPASS